MTKAGRLYIRLTEGEKRGWGLAASMNGLTLSDWVRGICSGFAPPEESTPATVDLEVANLHPEESTDNRLSVEPAGEYPHSPEPIEPTVDGSTVEIPEEVPAIQKPKKLVKCNRCDWLGVMKKREPVEGCTNCRWE